MKAAFWIAPVLAGLSFAYSEGYGRRYVGRPPVVDAGQAGLAYFAAGKGAAPLVVDLHYWSDDFRGYTGTDTPLDKAVIARGWHFIRPDLQGPNNHPDSCCSEKVVRGIRAAIDYGRAHATVTRVYVVGGSGGGYAALCAARSGVQADGWISWSAPFDLVQWYGEAGERKRQDILQCTSSTGGLNVAEARRRSPLFMAGPPSAPVFLYAGTRDQIVPPSHSRRMANALGDAAQLTIFSGGHEVHTNLIIRDIERLEKKYQSGI